jgi:cell division protein FtsB
MKFDLDIKQLIALFVVVATLGGFYYTTQLRLDRLEASIESKQPTADLSKIKKQVKNLQKRVKKLEGN